MSPRILVVKLSSLGDVVHTLPAVMDLRAAWPQAQIDWVVERSFAPLVQMCPAVQRVIPCDLRRWRKALGAADTRQQWREFRAALQSHAYDAVVDFQGLTKSALVARMARLTPAGRRFAMANRTDGSSYEAPTRWVAHVRVPLATQLGAVARGRALAAAVTGVNLPDSMAFGLMAGDSSGQDAPETVAFLHGASRADKCWPEARWIDLGRRLVASGQRIALAHGSDDERARAERIAEALGPDVAQVWPRLDVAALAQRLGGCAGAIGVDSGLSHIAVALGRPHVQLYNFDTAWRTGPPAWPASAGRQFSVYAPGAGGGPDVATVWAAWQAAVGGAHPARAAAGAA